MRISNNQQTRFLNNPSFVFFIALVIVALLTGCSRSSDNSIYLDGKTMGTTYHVTIPNPPSHLNKANLQHEIDSLLINVNQQMSTYIDDSQISTFNQLPINTWMNVEPDFISVLMMSTELSKLSQGKFDITIGPLIELWGFGKSWHVEVPSQSKIDQAKANTGWQKLKIDAANAKILKTAPIQLNTSAIAKGFGVDKVAELLSKKELQHYLVEIGGEVKVKGLNPKQHHWALGIEKPTLEQGMTEQIIYITDKAVATSGDYRNYFEQDGQRYSHTIDPQTGKPVNHKIGSVTVIADTAAMADGYATTLNVMGSIDAAMQLTEEKQLAAYFILYSDDKEKPYRTQYSTTFAQYLKQ